MSRYNYNPLDLSKQSLRLVRLLKGQFAADIQCEIFQTWLYQAGGPVPYEALSYTWGSMGKRAKITVDSCVMHITKNLHEALQHLRLIDEDRILWVDAISIDQDNIKNGDIKSNKCEIYTRTLNEY